jgi:hypothetical protein
MRLAFDTFTRVIRHFREFGASGHCLVITPKAFQNNTSKVKAGTPLNKPFVGFWNASKSPAIKIANQMNR